MNELRKQEQKENEVKKYKVYIHTNTINNKKYVGLTSLPCNLRFGKRGQNYKQCTHFWNAIQKYGWNNFEYSIIAENLTKEEAEILEITTINKLISIRYWH